MQFLGCNGVGKNDSLYGPKKVLLANPRDYSYYAHKFMMFMCYNVCV
jgi:hypothetical protein